MLSEQITDEQWQHFEEHGYVHLGRADVEEIGGLQQRIDDIMMGTADIDYEWIMMQLDRADAAAGTPLSATLLARAGVQRSADGGPPHCADMLWLNYPEGGAVFAVGTSAWINCLTDPFGDAARITRNVLARLRV